jgi:hypothetical protein
MYACMRTYVRTYAYIYLYIYERERTIDLRRGLRQFLEQHRSPILPNHLSILAFVGVLELARPVNFLKWIGFVDAGR